MGSAFYGKPYLAEHQGEICDDSGELNECQIIDGIRALEAELAAVKAELVECCDAMNADQTEVFVELRKLREKLAAARKDGERLDWIQNEGYAELFVGGAKGGLMLWSCCGHPATRENNTVRAAIDAAMAEGEGDG